MTTLGAVRDAALAGATAQAQALGAAARERAEQILAATRVEAAAVLSKRRDAATRLADLEERDRLAQVRADAAATVLSAQRTVLTEAREAVLAAAGRLVTDPRYSLLLERLEADARRRLSDGAPVRIVQAADGGFIAYAGSRQVDYSLAAQVDRCLEATGGELEQLWR